MADNKKTLEDHIKSIKEMIESSKNPEHKKHLQTVLDNMSKPGFKLEEKEVPKKRIESGHRIDRNGVDNKIDSYIKSVKSAVMDPKTPSDTKKKYQTILDNHAKQQKDIETTKRRREDETAAAKTGKKVGLSALFDTDKIPRSKMKQTPEEVEADKKADEDKHKKAIESGKSAKHLPLGNKKEYLKNKNSPEMRSKAAQGTSIGMKDKIFDGDLQVVTDKKIARERDIETKRKIKEAKIASLKTPDTVRVSGAVDPESVSPKASKEDMEHSNFMNKHHDEINYLKGLKGEYHPDFHGPIDERIQHHQSLIDGLISAKKDMSGLDKLRLTHPHLSDKIEQGMALSKDKVDNILTTPDKPKMEHTEWTKHHEQAKTAG